MQNKELTYHLTKHIFKLLIGESINSQNQFRLDKDFVLQIKSENNVENVSIHTYAKEAIINDKFKILLIFLDMSYDGKDKNIEEYILLFKLPESSWYGLDCSLNEDFAIFSIQNKDGRFSSSIMKEQLKIASGFEDLVQLCAKYEKIEKLSNDTVTVIQNFLNYE